MSEEQSSVPQRGGAAGGPQGGLLAQMDLLIAALNADLSALDAELQGSGGRGETPTASGAPGGVRAAEVRASAAGGSKDGPRD
ncbi:hypothetical protein AB0K81_02425 [Streptomyces werraensis]|uniref:Uncharacterized protein n=1 Tax=Streptomyces werraensis TaxID=68284 RepID=A0ABV3J7Y1_9ACTN